jgi:hypothetical protein
MANFGGSRAAPQVLTAYNLRLSRTLAESASRFPCRKAYSSKEAITLARPSHAGGRSIRHAAPVPDRNKGSAASGSLRRQPAEQGGRTAWRRDRATGWQPRGSAMNFGGHLRRLRGGRRDCPAWNWPGGRACPSAACAIGSMTGASPGCPPSFGRPRPWGCRSSSSSRTWTSRRGIKRDLPGSHCAGARKGVGTGLRHYCLGGVSRTRETTTVAAVVPGRRTE